MSATPAKNNNNRAPEYTVSYVLCALFKGLEALFWGILSAVSNFSFFNTAKVILFYPFIFWLLYAALRWLCACRIFSFYNWVFCSIFLKTDSFVTSL